MPSVRSAPRERRWRPLEHARSGGATGVEDLVPIDLAERGVDDRNEGTDLSDPSLELGDGVVVDDEVHRADDHPLGERQLFDGLGEC